MPEETETVAGNPAQEQNTDDHKDNTETSNTETLSQSAGEQVSPPSVEACILKTNLSTEATEPDACSLKKNDSSGTEAQAQVCPANSGLKSPEAMATAHFLQNERGTFEIKQIPHAELTDEQKAAVLSASEVHYEVYQVTQRVELTEPRTPTNSEASESGALVNTEEPQVSAPVAEPVTIEVIPVAKPVTIEVVEEPTTINGDANEVSPETSSPTKVEEVSPQCKLTNGQSNGEYGLESSKVTEPESISVERNQGLIETIAKELKDEDYKLPDVVEVKKHFEFSSGPAQNGVVTAPPKKGALSTRIDTKSIKEAYEDVRYDGSETQWAVFKFEGPTIVTSAKGADFVQFKNHFSDDERAFGYIRVQTGDEMSKRAKFLLLTWIGPSVSVLKRGKMSTDKALMKEILSNFAVELQTENIADVNLQNFETELDKAAGAHYGTGVRG